MDPIVSSAVTVENWSACWRSAEAVVHNRHRSAYEQCDLSRRAYNIHRVREVQGKLELAERAFSKSNLNDQFTHPQDNTEKIRIWRRVGSKNSRGLGEEQTEHGAPCAWMWVEKRGTEHDFERRHSWYSEHTHTHTKKKKMKKKKKRYHANA